MQIRCLDYFVKQYAKQCQCDGKMWYIGDTQNNTVIPVLYQTQTVDINKSSSVKKQQLKCLYGSGSSLTYVVGCNSRLAVFIMDLVQEAALQSGHLAGTAAQVIKSSF